MDYSWSSGRMINQEEVEKKFMEIYTNVKPSTQKLIYILERKINSFNGKKISWRSPK
jgi:hypothetical protein